MSAKAIEREIRRFLSSDKPEVLCIQGKWGVGKTYAWAKYLKEAIEAKKIEFSRYAYCSLFGINSLDQLKMSIVENTVQGSSLANKPSVSTFMSNLAEMGVRNSRGVVGAGLKTVGLSAAADLLGPAMYLAVRNQIVCIDDIERKGKGLHIEDVLGLMSNLKEHRNCKVVLILNDEKLSDVAELQTYFEKVIDASVAFAPTPVESAFIAIPEEGALEQHLRDSVISLEITNIRVIQRIRKLAYSLRDTFEGCDDRTLREMAASIALAAWMTFMPNDAPPSEFVKGRMQKRYSEIFNKSAPPSETELIWHGKLEKIGSSTMTQLDEELVSILRNGYMEDRVLAGAVKEAETKWKNYDLESVFTKAWSLFHDSFDDNMEELVTALVQSAKNAAQLVTPLNLDGTIRLLKHLGRPKEATEVLTHYINTRTDGREFFVLRKGHPLDALQDAEVIEAFRARALSMKDDRSLEVVVTEMSKGDRSTQNQERIASEGFETVVRVLKSLPRGVTTNALETFASLHGASGPHATKIAQMAEDFLEQLSKESTLNKLRVQSLRKEAWQP